MFERGCTPTPTLRWTLKLAFHVLFTGYNILFLQPLKKNLKTVLSPQAVQKQPGADLAHPALDQKLLETGNGLFREPLRCVLHSS